MSTTVEKGHYLVERVEAQRRSTWIQLAALVGAGICIALAARLQTPINQQRKDLGLVTTSEIYQELPPEYAWVSAAGGTFRGLAVDLLWIRAENLKQEGKYYESHQLAKWICTLQPRFPDVWSFQSWNMAYNISVALHTPQERWQWVYNGIRLLRDEGIPNNPRTIPLYHQLGWTYFHKIGGKTDNFHWDYKRQWAGIMQILLGKPPAGVPDKEVIDWFRPVAEAPHSVSKLIKQRPAVAKLVEKLQDLGIDVFAQTNTERVYHPLEEEFFLPFTKYLLAGEINELRETPVIPKDVPEELYSFFEQSAGDDFDALLACLRAKVLREQYKMDPQFMLKLCMSRLGVKNLPLDWRTCYAHAIYWATYGVDKGLEMETAKEFDILNTDRIVLFSLANLAKHGRIIFRLNPDNYMQSFYSQLPDTRFITAMHQKYLELGKRHAKEGEKAAKEGKITADIIRSGHVNNLHLAVSALYFEGKKDQAQKYLDYLAKNYKHPYTNVTKEVYVNGLDYFIEQDLKEYLESRNPINTLLYQIFNNAFYALAEGRDGDYRAAIQNAAWAYTRFQELQGGDAYGRYRFPKFAQVRADALAQFILYSGTPLSMSSTVWFAEAPEVKQRCYDFLAPELKRLCKRVGLSFEKAFPEPMGMDLFRKTHPELNQPDETRKERDKKYGPQRSLQGS